MNLWISILQMLSDLNTYLNKAIPDTKLTIKKYADVKFEYLVFPYDFLSFSQSISNYLLFSIKL